MHWNPIQVKAICAWQLMNTTSIVAIATEITKFVISEPAFLVCVWKQACWVCMVCIWCFVFPQVSPSRVDNAHLEYTEHRRLPSPRAGQCVLPPLPGREDGRHPARNHTQDTGGDGEGVTLWRGASNRTSLGKPQLMELEVAWSSKFSLNPF